MTAEHKRHLLVLSLAALLAGCTTGQYEGAITEFASATSTAQAALAEMATQLEDRERERRFDLAMVNRDAVQAGGDGCLSSSSGCQLVILQTGGEEPLPLEPGPQLQNTQALVREISRYAGLLADVAAADTHTQVDSAIAQLNDSISQIATQFGRPVPATISPAGDLAGWLIGAYLDHLKIDALRDATGAAEEAFPETEAFLVSLADILDEPSDVDHTLAFNAAEERFVSEAGTRADLLAWNQSAVRLDQALRVRAGDVFVKMRQAHKSLHDALVAPELDFQAAVALIEEYAKSAEELFEILQRLKAAAEQEG